MRKFFFFLAALHSVLLLASAVRANPIVRLYGATGGSATQVAVTTLNVNNVPFIVAAAVNRNGILSVTAWKDTGSLSTIGTASTGGIPGSLTNAHVAIAALSARQVVTAVVDNTGGLDLAIWTIGPHKVQVQSALYSGGPGTNFSYDQRNVGVTALDSNDFVTVAINTGPYITLQRWYVDSTGTIVSEEGPTWSETVGYAPGVLGIAAVSQSPSTPAVATASIFCRIHPYGNDNCRDMSLDVWGVGMTGIGERKRQTADVAQQVSIVAGGGGLSLLGGQHVTTGSITSKGNVQLTDWLVNTSSGVTISRTSYGISSAKASQVTVCTLCVVPSTSSQGDTTQNPLAATLGRNLHLTFVYWNRKLITDDTNIVVGSNANPLFESVAIAPEVRSAPIYTVLPTGNFFVTATQNPKGNLAIDVWEYAVKPIGPPQPVFYTRDISPDGSNYSFNNGDDPAGRILSLALDPRNDAVVYAASETAGVWKSTTGVTFAHGKMSAPRKMQWFQASNGLRNGITANNTSLAIDDRNSSRLLYATIDNDGRPPQLLGGLWVSTNAAGSWSHATLCSTPPTNITSVSFTNGRPYVSTACGILTTASADLKSHWEAIPSGSWPQNDNAPTLLAADRHGTLFACHNNTVFRSAVSAKPRVWTSFVLPGPCFGVTSVAVSTGASTFAVAIWGTANNQQVSVVDFTHSLRKDLNYPARAGLPTPAAVSPGGGGSSAVATATIPAARSTGPGISFDVYASDNCAWYGFSPASSPAWLLFANPGGGANCFGTGIHPDSWALVTPSWYDPAKGRCGAYASTDGGVFFVGADLQRPAQCASVVAGSSVSAWTPVQNGLHVLASDKIAAITAGSERFGSPGSVTLGIYLPTDDNDTFISGFGWQNWGNVSSLSATGDTTQVLVDPTFPQQVLVSRNGHDKTLNPPIVQPPMASNGTATDLLPQPKFTNADYPWGLEIGAIPDVSQVMNTDFSRSQTAGDYVGLRDDIPYIPGVSGCQRPAKAKKNTPNNEHVIRYSAASSSWIDIAPGDLFLSCDIVKVQTGFAGGRTNVYVLTTTNDANGPRGTSPIASFPSGRGPGQIYRGIIGSSGVIPVWNKASGSASPRPDSGAQPIAEAVNFYVNPYDASELYALDLGNAAQAADIKVSRDFGRSWFPARTLTDLATNHGEYVLAAGVARGQGPFVHGCSLSDMFFGGFPGGRNIRFAALFYGGIAFSRDSGAHWIGLDVTDNNHFLSQNLTEPVTSIYYDDQTPAIAAKVPQPAQMLYAALKGKSLKLIVAPFRTLESLNFSVKAASTTPSNAEAWVAIVTPSSLSRLIRMRSDGHRRYRASLVFDYDTTASTRPAHTVTYRYLIGNTIVPSMYLAPLKHRLEKGEIEAGVADLPVRSL